MAAFTQFQQTAGFGPTDEPLDSGYSGYANFNKGVDLATPAGTAVDAAVGGTVVAVGDQGDGWGISVKVRDAQGNTHNYGHLGDTKVQVGQQIAPGFILGASGNTGKSTGAHLSYDVMDANGSWIDPTPFLNQQAAPVVQSGGSIQMENPTWQSHRRLSTTRAPRGVRSG
jgi:murein DD-endopeptidase MepM/ murein hydrolase activator NlpD